MGNKGERILCPVHDRTQQGSELGLVGLAWAGSIDSSRPPKGLSAEEALWLGWLIPQGLKNHPRHDPKIYKAAITTLVEHLPFQHEKGWAPPGSIKEVLKHVKRVSRSDGFLAFIHCGMTEGDELPGSIKAFADETELNPHLLGSEKALCGASEAMRRLADKISPYYEALAPLDLYFLGRNRYHDPVPKWKPLLEETEVPAGKEYQSPEPNRDFSLPAGEVPSIDLYIRIKRHGNWEYRRLTFEQEHPQVHPEPVFIKVRISPGRGLAHVVVSSKTPNLFEAHIDEAHLKATDSPPPIMYAWPPGSAFVVSHNKLIFEDPYYAIRPLKYLLSNASGGIASKADLKSAREAINKWLAPIDVGVDLEDLEFPEEIHELFVYLGVMPSHSSPVTKKIEEVTNQIVSLLERSYAANQGKNYRHSLRWFSSWLYLRIPKAFLDEVKQELCNCGSINGSFLACAGNCFSKPGEFKLFFDRFDLQIKEGKITPEYWLRAYRNLARFRVQALSNSVLGSKEQKNILDWYLKVFEEALDNPKGHKFLYSVYLAPHILKRRRFDNSFLKEGTEEFARFESCLKIAAKVAFYSNHGPNAECALEFLYRTATQATLEKLRDADQP